MLPGQKRAVACILAIAAQVVSCQEESSNQLGLGGQPGAEPAAGASQESSGAPSSGAPSSGAPSSGTPSSATSDGGVGASDGGGASNVPSNANDKYAALRELCVRWTNDGEGAVRGRTATGGTPLSRNVAKESCVDEQGKVEMANDRAQTGFHSSLGRCGDVMQNTCGGEGYFSEADARELLHNCLISRWLTREAATNGPHYRQIMSAQATAVTCGFYEDGQGGLEIVQAFFR